MALKNPDEGILAAKKKWQIRMDNSVWDYYNAWNTLYWKINEPNIRTDSGEHYRLTTSGPFGAPNVLYRISPEVGSK